MSTQAQAKELIADWHRSPDFTEMAALPSAERALHRHRERSPDLPQPDCLVPSAAGQGLAVRAERYRLDCAGVASEGGDAGAAGPSHTGLGGGHDRNPLWRGSEFLELGAYDGDTAPERGRTRSALPGHPQGHCPCSRGAAVPGAYNYLGHLFLALTMAWTDAEPVAVTLAAFTHEVSSTLRTQGIRRGSTTS